MLLALVFVNSLNELIIARTDFWKFKNFVYQKYAEFVPQTQYHYLQILFFIIFFEFYTFFNLIFLFRVFPSFRAPWIRSIFLCQQFSFPTGQRSLEFSLQKKYSKLNIYIMFWTFWASFKSLIYAHFMSYAKAWFRALL